MAPAQGDGAIMGDDASQSRTRTRMASDSSHHETSCYSLTLLSWDTVEGTIVLRAMVFDAGICILLLPRNLCGSV